MKKRNFAVILAVLLAVVAMSSVFMAAMSSPRTNVHDGAISFSDYKAGDVNGNNTVNITDLVRLKKYHAQDDVRISTGSDINIDGKVDSADLVLLRSILLGVEIKLQ